MLSRSNRFQHLVYAKLNFLQEIMYVASVRKCIFIEAVLYGLFIQISGFGQNSNLQLHILLNVYKWIYLLPLQSMASDMIRHASSQ